MNVKSGSGRNSTCLGGEKGRRHPMIERKLLDKLFEYFKPFDIEFFKIINQNPFWQF